MVWLQAMDFIGTIAFALSGAVLGLRRKFDLFGIVILSITTAVGGGILRDLLTGFTPPLALRDPLFCGIAAVTALLASFYGRKVLPVPGLIGVFDALGLAAFATDGALLSLDRGFSGLFLTLFVACVTGVGGGVLRDVLAGEVPLVFRREIYALAALAGGMVFWCSKGGPLGGIAAPACFVVTLAVRLVAMKADVNLPVPGLGGALGGKSGGRSET